MKNLDCCSLGTKKQESELKLFLRDSKKYKFTTIKILQGVQKIYGYLPKSVLEVVSKETGMADGELFSVASFYAEFSFSPRGKSLISVDNEKENVFDAKEGELALDGRFCIDKNCIGCGLCKRECPVKCIAGEVRNIHIIDELECVGCGKCVKACPTGAIKGNSSLRAVQDILKNKNKEKIVAPAPAVRVAIMEEFGLSPKDAEGILPTLFKKLGFDRVFDVNFGADLTAIKEGEEFLKRIETGKNLPLFTSCCPAWVNFMEKFYPELGDNISVCKSPMLALGEAIRICDAKNVSETAQNKSVVAVMPCTAKKAERRKPCSGIDCVITVNELLYLINESGINVKKLQPSEFDPMFGKSSGAGVIFGRAGGVSSAIVRAITGETKAIDFHPISGINNAKISTIKLGKNNINIVSVSGLGPAQELIEKIKKQEIVAHLVEVMACEGGCINGSEMPKRKCDSPDAKALGLDSLDQTRQVRLPQENKEVQEYLFLLKNINK